MIVEKKPSMKFEDINLFPLETIAPENLKDEIYQRIQYSCQCCTFREQITLVVEPYKSHNYIPSYEFLGSIFGITRGSVYNHIQRYYKEKQQGINPAGRPSVLSNEIKESLNHKIADDYSNHIPCTYASLSEWLEQTYNIVIIPDTLGSIIRKDQNFKVVKASTMEDKRVLCSVDSVDSYFNLLNAAIFNKPACLIANLDEMGYQEYKDCPKQSIIVPSWVDEKTAQISVDKTKRRMTILKCIFGDGTSIPPLIIISRKTLDKELYDKGYTPDKCMFAYQNNGFITSDIFMIWAMKFLIPEFIRRVEELIKYNLDPNDLRGILLMDGLKQHFTDFFEDECFINGIDIIELPAHSSDQTQPLDLCIFAACKKILPRCLSDAETKQSKEVEKLITAMEAASTQHNIRKSFERGGIITEWNGDMENGILMCRVDLNNCTRV